jgi:CRISPR/Cas system-associated endonuclease Cas1
VVDSLVLELINSGEFVPPDFEDIGEGKLILTPPALKKFFIKWETWQRTIVNNQDSKMNWRQVFNRQIEQLEHSVLHGGAYQAFTMV